MPKITPFLWFDTQAEDAMNFYASTFKWGANIAPNAGRSNPSELLRV